MMRDERREKLEPSCTKVTLSAPWKCNALYRGGGYGAVTISSCDMTYGAGNSEGTERNEEPEISELQVQPCLKFLSHIN
jgi:hypothetical protein